MRLSKLAALFMSLALVAAACGSDAESGDAEAPETTEAAGASETTEAAGGDSSDDSDSGDSGEGDSSEGDGSAQAGADWLAAAEASAVSSPLVAVGEPIVIGFQNPEGDPAASFPEWRIAVEAAVEYINNELGGIGADYESGTPGRPIELEVCSMTLAPADSLRCANEIVSNDAIAVVSSINFFGNHLPIYNGAGIPVIIGNPAGALDFTSPNAFAITSGCVGVQLGQIAYVTQDLGSTSVGVPYSDTPPGQFCYFDLNKKPLEVLAGVKQDGSDIVAVDNEYLGSVPGLTFEGVPIKPNQADLTPQATQVFGSDPTSIIFAAPGTDCWSLFDSLVKVGWTMDQAPYVATSSCLDFEKLEQAGDDAIGMSFVGPISLMVPSSVTGQAQDEALTYAAKMEQYASDPSAASKGFGATGFMVMMNTWMMINEAANGDADSLTPEAISEALAATSNHHQWGGSGLDCADGETFAPYVSICNSTVGVTQWNGSSLDVVRNSFSGVGLVQGTDLALGS